jgi:uncharacterized membrane protein YjjP (DUF1212 family)
MDKPKKDLKFLENQEKDKKFNHELLEFMASLGKSLTSAGISVTAVQSILYDIARAYDVKAEILIFTTFLIIKLGDEESPPLTTVNQISGLSHLNQVSELYELIYLAEKAEISPREGQNRLKEITCQKHRFGVLGIILGYILFALGLGMLLQPTPQQLVVSGFLGGIVSLLLISSENKPRLTLILPVLAAFIVSTIVFWGVKEGLILVGSFTILVPALAYFLPGATLTTGMFELASGDMISGASRTIYGITILFLLLFGVLIGIQITGLSQHDLIINSIPISTFGWIPLIGILLFAMGMFLFMSMRTKDLPWVILVLYIAFFGQQVGNYFIGSFFGAFLGSLFMTVSGTLIGRSPNRTPSFVSTISAFWFLVPGSLGFIGLATLIGQNYFTAVNNLILLIMTVVAISLGLLIGAAIAEPLRLQKIKSKLYKDSK